MSDGPVLPSDTAAAPLEAPQRAAERSPHAALRDQAELIRREVGRIFIGSDAVVESLLIALLARGHVLLEGVPGVAKTTLVRAFSQTVAASFKRIQFTPDLLPSDITGVYVPNLHTQEFALRPGPIFAHIVLGDEINRAPAKTQSALLEAMQEEQVTIEGVTHKLPSPFLVMATQNPLEQEGVYPLPEAQLDRFLLKITIGYPTPEQELRVLKTHERPVGDLPALLDPDTILAMRAVVDSVHVGDDLMQYILKLVRFTRDHAQIALGASPRAALALLRASKARAALHGRDYVLPDDIRALATSVLGHRVLLQPEAELSGVKATDIVRQALQKIRYSDG